MPRLKILTAAEVKEFDHPPKLNSKQKQKAFALTERLLACIGKTRSLESKAAIVIQSGYFRATGKFFSPDDFHRSDVLAVCRLLGCSPVDLTEYKQNHGQHHKHKKMVLNYFGFTAFDKAAKQILKDMLSRLASHDGDPKEMIYHASSQLHQQNIEIPSYDTFQRLITDALNQIEAQYEATISENITQAQTVLLEGLLETDDDGYFSKLKRWKQISQSERPAKIQASVSLFTEIKSTFDELPPLIEQLSLSDNSLHYYSGWTERAKLYQIKKLRPHERYLRLIAFIQHQVYCEPSATLFELK